MTFASLFSRYQIGLETSLKGSDLIFDCTDLLYYKSHNILWIRLKTKRCNKPKN